MLRFGIASVIAMTCLSFTAFAGEKGPQPVVIEDSFQVASGSLGSARNWPDTRQFIGCELSAGAGGTAFFARCYATDATGKFAQCATTDTNQIRVIEFTGPDSLVQFSWIPGTSVYGYNKCGTIAVTNGSSYEPKKP